ncbi:MAG: hypothetical protein KME26_14515 [Oscillatoria princeps RMCB-10]|jgi:hypothetical protein|nr:hypothetical protein [Oscillatoria princeps RMCB-10]
MYSYSDWGINLNEYSFEEWVDFVFDHPVTDPPWHHGNEWEWTGDIEHLLPYVARLFRNPDFLLDKYSEDQLIQGFGYLSSWINVPNWIWRKDVPWPLREECIFSMVTLCERLFVKNPLDETCSMWWNWFRYYGEDPPEERVGEAMLQALSQVLKLPSTDCWASALYGLANLQHSGKKEVIESFLQAHPDLEEGWKSLASAAIEGKGPIRD